MKELKELICYYNGEYMKESEVKTGLWDMVWLEGCVYDMSRTYNHVPFFWKEHIDRLFRTLQGIHLDIGLSPEEVSKISLEVYKRNKENLHPDDDFYVVQRVSRGAMPSLPSPPTKPTVLINCAYLSPQYERMARYYQEGVQMVVANTRAIPPQCFDQKIKNSNRFCNASADFEAKMINPEAIALMLDVYGFAAECPRMNFLMVKDGKLFTSRATSSLAGVTRGTLLQLATELNIKSAETDISVYDLYNAEEIMVTANSFVIYPVAKFNERIMPRPIPGPITEKLFTAFNQKVGVDITQRVINHVEVQTKRG